MSIALEYARYIASQKIERYFLNTFEGRDRYEAKNILERWILNLYNDADDIYQPISTKESDDKFISEFIAKIPGNPKKSLNLIKEFIRDMNKSMVYDDAKILDGKIIYSEVSFPITPRINYLIDISNPTLVMKMLLRYESLFMGGNQWGIPFNVADILYEIGFRIEGFASPLNSRFIDKKDSYFNSLFFDTDHPFGSLGNFFHADFDSTKGYYMINPPYLPSFFESDKLLERINDLLDHGKVIHFLMPAWKDSFIYHELLNSRYLETIINLERRKYYYQAANREKIIATFDSVIFILGKKFPDNIIKEIIKLWTS